MKFGAYLRLHRLRQEEVALALSCSVPTVSRLCTEASPPSLGLAQKINIWSGGAVGLQDWDLGNVFPVDNGVG